jgi:hypothetical protein
MWEISDLSQQYISGTSKRALTAIKRNKKNGMNLRSITLFSLEKSLYSGENGSKNIHQRN